MNRRAALVALTALAMLATLALPAAADHTDPNSPLTLNPSTDPVPGGEPSVVPSAEGEWEHLWSFPGHQASDITFFNKGGDLYASQGTLGQGPARSIFVGQRIVQLMEGDALLDPPRIRADHGSAACGDPVDAANTGLQHDSFATPPADPEILVDASDSVGRCHDEPGGGLELIDISGLDDDAFQPRELHLIRFNAWSHTTSLDPERPWIIFSNNSDTTGTNFLDFADIRSCLSESVGGTIPEGTDLDKKRELCRPVVYRIPFEEEWTQQTIDGEQEPQGTPAMCHDIVIEDNVVHCSGLSSEVLLDISNLTDPNGKPRGLPLPCTLIPGTATGAMVTDCSLGGPTARGEAAHTAWEAAGSPRATGWEHLGHFNHPGRTHAPSNSNLNVPAEEGIAVSHESRAFPAEATGDRRYMLVSDERGGGVVPGGASCSDDNFDVYGHGGLHVFDITDPSNIQPAKMLDDAGGEQRAFWRTDNLFPQPSFCVVHRFRFLEGEQRIVMGYYTQGVRILDYEIDENGFFSFTEVGSYAFKDSNTWTGDVFHTVDNADGTRTYYIAASDTLGAATRGMDVLSWTAEPNPVRPPGTEAPGATVQRLAGDNRFETAVDISSAGFSRSETVFLARGDDYADALAGGPLAAAQGAPILLTHRDELTDVTEAEIRRLGASRAVLLGGTVAIDASVAARLEELGLTVERVEGINRFATAAAAAKSLGDDSGTVFLTEGDHADPTRGWPDALSAAPYAAFAGQPVLLTVHGTLPDETRQALKDAGAEETIVVGGSSAVSDEVFDEVRDAGHGPRRLAGDNRYETNVAVYDEAMTAGMAPDVLWVATGGNWPDALTAGATAGPRGDMLVLVDGQTMDASPATRDLIAARRADIRHVNVLGGTDAIASRVLTQLRNLLAEGTTGSGAVPPATSPTPRGPWGLPALPVQADTLLLLLLAGLLLPAASLFGRRRQARLGT